MKKKLMEGKARELGLVHAGMAVSILRHGALFKAPCVLLSGGEQRQGLISWRVARAFGQNAVDPTGATE